MGWTCRHCGAPLTRERGAGRGLCWTCYRKRDVRHRYPRDPRGPVCEDDEPTAEEVERLVADGFAALPDWWDEETEAEKAREYAMKVYTLVRCT